MENSFLYKPEIWLFFIFFWIFFFFFFFFLKYFHIFQKEVFFVKEGFRSFN